MQYTGMTSGKGGHGRGNQELWSQHSKVFKYSSKYPTLEGNHQDQWRVTLQETSAATLEE